MLQFNHFSDPIYIATQLTNYICILMKIYILWREYSFNKNVQHRPLEVRHLMSGQDFKYLKKLHQKMIVFEMIEESWLALVHLVFVDELCLRSLWDISSKLSSGADEMSITRIFILISTCKDFLLLLPLDYYVYTREYHFTSYETVKMLLKQFFSIQLIQFIILNIWTYSAFMLSNVSQSALIISISISLATFVFARDVLIINILSENEDKPLTDAAILGDLRPFLERMKFPERNIYLYKATKKELPNAFTMGQGLFTDEKILIADNIIGKNPHLNQCCTHGEVASIIMHELGHIFHRHILKTCLLEFAISTSTCVFFVLLYQPRVFEAFGFPGETPVLMSFLVRMEVLLSFNVVCAFLFMLHLRRCEYQADLFSFTFSRDHYRQALLKISLVRPEDIQVHDTLYSAWTFSHPSLIERLDYLYN